MSVYLTRIHCELDTGHNYDDGMDWDSTMTIAVRNINSSVRLAEMSFGGNDSSGGSEHDGDKKFFDLTLHTNMFPKEEINNGYILEEIIVNNTHDHYSGRITATFYFSDGYYEANAFDFAIGTYHESNVTHQNIHLNYAFREGLDAMQRRKEVDVAALFRGTIKAETELSSKN